MISKERLQKVIANSGITLGTQVGVNDKVEVNGVLISKEEKVYFLLNKPREVITAVSDDKGRKTVVDLINENKRIYPVGRLDYDTTGAIILTNDGEFANLMMHPKNETDKCYIAKIEGTLSPKELMILKTGVVIDKVKTKRAKVKIRKIDKVNNTSIVEITIHEGRNHQVKKMFESVGHTVLKLKRERIAFLTLEGLKSGEYRKLTHKEVTTLYSLAVNK